MANLTKTQIIDALAKKLWVSKKMASEMLNAFVELVISSVASWQEVRMQGFGTFKSSHRDARKWVNPRNPKESITIPAMNVVTFKAGSEFKSAVR